MIVARQVKRGEDREAKRWLMRLKTLAAQAPGHLGADVQAPNSQHPDEWVIVYQFASTQLLQNWLDSPRRRELLEAGAHLFVEPPREQILAIARTDRPVTAVSSFLVAAEGSPAFQERYAELQLKLAPVPGFLRCELFEPVPDAQEETVIVFSFASREGLDRWLSSDVRKQWLDSLEPLLAGERKTNVIGGFAGWFGSPGAPPVKRWKQAALVLLALYPTALAFAVVRAMVFPSVSEPFGILFGNIVGVAILSWILMPWLTTLFDNWLRR